MDTNSPVDEYARACAAYTSAVVRADDARIAAERRYREDVAGVRVAAERAVATRDTAQKRSATAESLITAVDDSAADLWRRVIEHTVQPGLGPTPAPADTEETVSAPEIRARLNRVAKQINQSKAGRFPLAAPPRTPLVAALIGAVIAAIAVLSAGLLFSAGGAPDGSGPILRAAALVIVFLGVVAGVPVVIGWLALRHRMGPQPVPLIACVVAGLVTTIALAIVLL